MNIDDADAEPATPGEDPEDLDEVAVQALMAGRQPAGLREIERVAAVRRLAEHGWSDHSIGRQLGVCDRTVLRLRQIHQIRSGWSA